MYEHKYFEEQIEEEIEPETSKTKVFLLEIRLFFTKLKYFPIYCLKFFKNSFLSLLKAWGIWGTVLIIGFLRYTETYKLIYYKVGINIENYRTNKSLEVIEKHKLIINSSESKTECYKNQLLRSANNAHTEIGYCNNN